MIFETLVIAALGMSVVFLFLAIMIAVVEAMGKMLSVADRFLPQAPQAAPAAIAPAEGSAEIAAVIAAAMRHTGRTQL